MSDSSGANSMRAPGIKCNKMLMDPDLNHLLICGDARKIGHTIYGTIDHCLTATT